MYLKIKKANSYDDQKSNRNTYYIYLVASVRENGKVKQKTLKYLGKFIKSKYKTEWIDNYNISEMDKAYDKIKEYGSQIINKTMNSIKEFLNKKGD